MKGRITLYFENTIVVTRQYECETRKQKFIDQWRRMYGPGFKRATVVDEPDADRPKSRFEGPALPAVKIKVNKDEV